MELRVGARFPSFKALEAAIEKLSQQTNSVYTVYNSRLIDKENSRRPLDKQLPLCLKYRHIKFACKHYGMRKSKSRGLRPNQSTFKIGCPSYIYATARCRDLVIDKMDLEHTHSCDPELVALYPERRSLSHLGSDDGDDEDDGVRQSNSSLKMIREDVYDLLSLAVDRRRIRNYVRICTGRVMLTGDLANMAKYVRQNPRDVSDERANQLLEHVKLVESKENVPATRPMTTREKFNAMKRRVALPSEISKDEDLGDEDPTGPPRRKRVREMKRQDESVIQIRRPEHQESLQDESQGDQVPASWDHNSSLADVVKSILGPNQEGPVIVHVNNYEGVAVVEVAEPQKYGTGEEIDPSTLLVQKQTVDETQTSSVRRTARKSLSPRTPYVVSHKPTSVNENVPTSKVIITTKEQSPSKNSSHIQVSSKSDGEGQHHEEDYEDEYEQDFDGGNTFDESDDNSEHGSVLKEERTMYQVKTQKLKLQIRHLTNDLEKQELEKEKLRLEIRLLEMQVDEMEAERGKVKNQ